MSNETRDDEPRHKAGSSLVVGGLAVLSALYLLNPGFGIFDLIPDNLPVVGNLDETAAAALLVSSLAYFGFDPSKLVHRILAILGLVKQAGKTDSADEATTIDVESR